MDPLLLSKSIRKCLYNSVVSYEWNKAKKIGQDFLYVQGSNYDLVLNDIIYMCGCDQKGLGDYFIASDLIEYKINVFQ